MIREEKKLPRTSYKSETAFMSGEVHTYGVAKIRKEPGL